LHDDHPLGQTYTFTPIGIAHTPFPDRVSTPRQPHAALDVPGRIELFPGRGLEHAVSDLEGWEYLWIIFCFHLNEGWRPKVLPPRSTGKRRGVLSTRSPHRPNPIGLSLVRLVSVDGLNVHVKDVDIIDKSPVLDIKPYLPYVEAKPQARTGWVESLVKPEGETPQDPEPGFAVTWSERAAEQAAFLHQEYGIDVHTPVTATLTLGPQPHPYRRIRKKDDGTLELAHKDLRIRFRLDKRDVTVLFVSTGYREKELFTSEEPRVAAHRALIARFGRET